MPFKDLREFIEVLGKDGDVQQMKGAHWDLEVGALTEIVAGKKNHPALLFDRIGDYPEGYRILTNVLTTVKRTAIALGLPGDTSGMDVLKLWKDKLVHYKSVPPKVVRDGPVMENIHLGDSVDIFEFPAPKWHEQDPGRFIGTGDMVIMRDPDNGWVNVAAQRNMVYDRNCLGILCMPGKHEYLFLQRYHQMGKPAPVAISFGHEPAVWLPAGMRLPYGVSEYDFAGWLREEPVEVITGEITGLPIPATSEIAIEGEIPPMSVEQRIEGPFGEFTGYYGAGPAPQPVVKIKAIYHRNDPILLGVPPMKPPIPNYAAVPFLAADTWDALIKAGVPDVQGVWQCLHRLMTVVSVKQRYAGHAKQAGLVAAGAKGTAYVIKYLVVVDDDIDITSLDDVMWAVVTRCNPETSVDIVRECLSASIDPAIHPDLRIRAPHGVQSNSKMIINACKPFAWMDEYPKTNQASPHLRATVMKKYEEFLKKLGD